MPAGDVETFHPGGAWWNRIEGGGQVIGHAFRTRAEAAAAGREVARARQVEHLVRDLEGRIGDRSTYGHDPRSIPG
ncbi:DUF2188 domain-containing protein [Microbacterium sp.]|uniref:DUF2188 domain-containing protein n=1 Tax=Microbacterium sp. TaxID=51671 RepID=UPI0028110A6E|nr:DUF2188 domain-containing protein [Microbacterium sp.]